MTEDKPVTLYECAEATRDRGLVGERKNVLTCDIASISGEKVVLNGPSRSGKDEILDGTEWLHHEIPDVSGEIDWEQEYRRGTTWYHWPSEISPKAPFYNAPTINMFPIQRFMDFVSIGEVIEGIAKAFGEDKAATHEKVDVSLSDAGGSQDQIENMVLESPRACFFTIASDNDKIDFRTDYEELRKRVVVLDTDASEELTRRIQRRQAEIRSGRYDPRIDSQGLERIRAHHRNIPVETFVGDGDGEFKDIVSEPLVFQEPIPAKFVEGRYDNMKLMEMTSGVTLFHHDRRMKIPKTVSESGKHQLVTTPVDAYYGMKIFGENMVLSALNLKELDKVILSHLREHPNENFTTLDMQSVVRAEGLNPGEPQIRSSLEGMREKTYVEKDDSGNGRVKYRAAFLGQQISLKGENIIDWNQLVDDTKEVAKDVLSDSWADRYISEYCEGDGLIATHPLTGEEVDIREANELEEEVQEAMDEQGEEFDKPLYGSSSSEEESEETTEDSGKSEPEVQATL